jgi:hypothetical protein
MPNRTPDVLLVSVMASAAGFMNRWVTTPEAFMPPHIDILMCISTYVSIFGYPLESAIQCKLPKRMSFAPGVRPLPEPMIVAITWVTSSGRVCMAKGLPSNTVHKSHRWSSLKPVGYILSLFAPYSVQVEKDILNYLATMHRVLVRVMVVAGTDRGLPRASWKLQSFLG